MSNTASEKSVTSFLMEDLFGTPNLYFSWSLTIRIKRIGSLELFFTQLRGLLLKYRYFILSDQKVVKFGSKILTRSVIFFDYHSYREPETIKMLDPLGQA